MNAAAGVTADTQRAPPAPLPADAAVGPLHRSWFERDPVTLASALLGQLVVRESAGQRRIGRIVETEAYAGMDDRASHARAGRTRRTEPMFGPAGHAYVYLVYGMHHCLNVVAEGEGRPSAVLIRALEPVAGVDAMRHARNAWAGPEPRLLAGPALACAGMSIDRTLDGHDLTHTGALWIADAGALPHPDPAGGVLTGPRIGVAYAGPGWADRPWRFGVAGSASLSRPFPDVSRGDPTDGLMDARSQELLEYPVLRARLAGYASFAPSRRLAETLTPSSDPVIVARLLDETDEARALLSSRPDVGVGGARDIGLAIGRADRGGRLEPADLVAVAETLVAAARLADALRPVESPRLHELARMISPLPSLRDRLLASVDPAGEILDSASPALGGLRRGVRIAYERLRARLEQLVHGAELGSALQEPIVTLRNGRYVIPVRAEAKAKVRGIVHDQSGSGQTLFIEPLVAVEMGNAWREAQLKVQVEEERILDELSALVGAQSGMLRETLDALARFDFWVSRAQLAAELNGIRAETSKRDVVLLSARHPGLSGRVVPIDLRIGDGYTAVVITGPNTGGKTVALRTVGLLCLMHQSGLHVPAAVGSRLPILRDVFADIGDEQSVAQSLSTFSGHLRSIVRIVDAAGPGCLVLLDELGAGTDPTEGSALAQALLDQFIRSGALVVATTHYAELKIYAHETPQARNASVEFDLETLSPTYRLTIGLPGTSQAFAIAARLGLSPELVADARTRLSRAQQDFEQTLASIKASQQDIDTAREAALVAESRALEARRIAEDERRRARQERREAAAAAREEAAVAVAAIHAEIAAARDLLSRQTLTESRLDEAMARLEQRLGANPGGQAAPEESAADTGEWHIGDRASTRSGWVGTIAAVDVGRGRATLAAGGAHVEVPLTELEHGELAARQHDPSLPGAPALERPGTGRRGDFGAPEVPRAPRGDPAAVRAALGARSGPPRAIPATLDVRGARVDEVIELLDQTLDNAALAGAGRLTVIHGHGTGALRDAVRNLVSGHPLVKDWRPGERGEGGDGATIISL